MMEPVLSRMLDAVAADHKTVSKVCQNGMKHTMISSANLCEWDAFELSHVISNLEVDDVLDMDNKPCIQLRIAGELVLLVR